MCVVLRSTEHYLYTISPLLINLNEYAFWMKYISSIGPLLIHFLYNRAKVPFWYLRTLFRCIAYWYQAICVTVSFSMYRDKATFFANPFRITAPCTLFNYFTKQDMEENVSHWRGYLEVWSVKLCAGVCCKGYVYLANMTKIWHTRRRVECHWRPRPQGKRCEVQLHLLQDWGPGSNPEEHVRFMQSWNDGYVISFQ